MNTTHLSAVLLREASHLGYTQAKLAELTRLTQGAISQLIAKGYRAAPATLRRLTHCWPNPATGIAILAAHIQDEIRRAGFRPADFEIRHNETPVLGIPTELEEDLAFIREKADQVPILRELVHNIATLTREELQNTKETRAAAESRTPYGNRKP